MRRQNTAIGARSFARPRFEHNARCAVAEKDAGSPVLPIENPRKGFGSDDKGSFVRSRGQEFVCRRQSEDKSRTDRLEIEGSTAGHADRRLNLRRDGGKRKIRRRSGDNEQIDVFALRPASASAACGSMRRQRRRAFVLGRDMTHFDAGALGDPRIAGVEHFLEISVAQNPLWKIRPQASDDGAENGILRRVKEFVLFQAT